MLDEHTAPGASLAPLRLQVDRAPENDRDSPLTRFCAACAKPFAWVQPTGRVSARSRRLGSLSWMGRSERTHPAYRRAQRRNSWVRSLLDHRARRQSPMEGATAERGEPWIVTLSATRRAPSSRATPECSSVMRSRTAIPMRTHSVAAAGSRTISGLSRRPPRVLRNATAGCWRAVSHVLDAAPRLLRVLGGASWSGGK